MINTKLLIEKIEYTFGSKNGLTRFYCEMGNAPYTVRRKIKGEADFSSSEIEKISKLLKLTPQEILVIFFGTKVDWNEKNRKEVTKW